MPPENEQKKESSVETLRTFKSDVSSYLQKKKISWEELVKRRGSEEQKFSAIGWPERKWIFIAAFFVLIILIFSTLFFLSKPAEKISSPIFRPPQTLIRANELVEIKASDRKSFFNEWKNLQAKTLPYKDFRGIYLVKEEAGEKMALGSAEVFDFLEIPLPLSLKDSLSDETTFGVIKADVAGKNEPVFMVGIQNFSRAFAAMLKWEPEMAKDFRFFIEENKIFALEAVQFSDIVVQNQNARILYNKENQPVIAYTIFNKKILIIGFSREALDVLLSKLLK